MKPIVSSKFYLIGGGIAALATAAYLIRDGKVNGKNILILEESENLGGSMDGKGSDRKGYVCRGFRMYEEVVHSCMFDLFSFIPSIDDAKKTILEDFKAFNKNAPISDRARLIEKGEIIDAHPTNLNKKDRLSLLKLFITSERAINNVRIDEYFTSDFFNTNFWFEWCTVFAFQPWHSLIEMKRYMIRYLQDSPFMDTMSCGRLGRYNEYDFVIKPLTNWLKSKDVNFKKGMSVINLDIEIKNKEKLVKQIIYKNDGKNEIIKIEKNDFVFATLGSMVTGSSEGSMIKAPKLVDNNHLLNSPSWVLWENIAKLSPDFGNPAIFNSNIDKTQFESFTITSYNQKFFELIEKKTGNKAGTGGGITFKNSGWLISLILPSQPYFIDQAKETNVCWGYALRPDCEGDFIKKKMTECSGKELLVEIIHQFGFDAQKKDIITSSICIPVLLPLITSQFMPRSEKDRPMVVPEGSTNLAFIGQFVEIQNEVVFTVEGSVRSAQIAVYTLLELNKKVTKLQLKRNDPKTIYRALKKVLTQ